MLEMEKKYTALLETGKYRLLADLPLSKEEADNVNKAVRHFKTLPAPCLSQVTFYHDN
jgi:hypothetical protein